MAAAIDVLNFRAVVLDLLRQENPEDVMGEHCPEPSENHSYRKGHLFLQP